MKSIVELMKSEGLESLDFFYHQNKPTVQKDGSRYEILSIEPIDENSIEMTGIMVYPCYEHKLQYLTVDNTWRRTSINHIKNIVQQEINKLYE